MASINESFYKCGARSKFILIHSRANHQLTRKHIKDSTQQTTQDINSENCERSEVCNFALHKNSFSEHLMFINHFSNISAMRTVGETCMNGGLQTLHHSELPTREESKIKQTTTSISCRNFEFTKKELEKQTTKIFLSLTISLTKLFEKNLILVYVWRYFLHNFKSNYIYK